MSRFPCAGLAVAVSLLAVPFGFADALVVRVANEDATPRLNETVSVPWADVVAALPHARPATLRVLDLNTGRTLAARGADANADGAPEALVFRCDFGPAPGSGGDLGGLEGTHVFRIEEGATPPDAATEAAAEPEPAAASDRPAARLRRSILVPASAACPDRSRVCWAHRVSDSLLETYPEPSSFDAIKPGRWDYTTGFTVSGLLAAAGLGGENSDRYVAYAKRWVDLFVDPAGRFREGVLHRDGQALDDVLPGRVLLALHRSTGEARYLTAARELIRLLDAQPRTREGGFWHKKVYPHQMWLDGAYMASPLLVDYAAQAKEPRYFDDAARQLALMYEHTRDAETGLLFHGWDESKTQAWADPRTGASPVLWGRALGWYMMSLVDCLERLPADHPRRAELTKILRSLAAALARYQDASTGLWHDVLDKGARADDPHETSCTAMFTYALAKGARLGYLEPGDQAVAQAAFAGLLRHHVYLDEQGRFNLTGTVRVGTLNPRYSKGDYASYVMTERRLNDLKGVGAFLLAAVEIEPSPSRR
jgi:unsaturated rhamnogalacturonyl hydrolase